MNRAFWVRFGAMGLVLGVSLGKAGAWEPAPLTPNNPAPGHTSRVPPPYEPWQEPPANIPAYLPEALELAPPPKPAVVQPLPKPAAVQPPPKPAGEQPLPVPHPLPFPLGCGAPPGAEPVRPSATPRPSKEVLEEFNQFVEQRVDPTNTLDVISGRQVLLRLKQATKKIQMPDENVAKYELLSPKELTVTGKLPGTTVLNIWFADAKDPTKDKILSYLVRVLADPESQERREEAFRRLGEEINQKFPDSVVHLTLLNDKLLVCGQAKDGFEARQILRVVGVNEEQQARPAIEAANLNINVNPGPNGLPAGGVPNYLVETPTGERYSVVNLLHVPGEQQVMLRVTVAEINRTAARSIGVDFSVLNRNGGQVFASTVGGIAAQTINVASAGTGATVPGGTGNAIVPANNLPFTIDNGRIVAAVNALKNLDFARTLSEPTLTALNGQTASSQVGGQFPVPVVTGFTAAGLQGVSFVPFGVQMSFTPTITDKNLIRLQMSAEVSTRDPGSAAAVNGTNVPGLNTRNFQTTVELRDGQTLAVAGLIQNNFGVDAARVPLFGELPGVGHLFGFDRTASGEQELVVLVTPELVHPIEPVECPPLPGADVFEPGDLEFYVLGRLESRRPEDFRASVRTDLAREARYRHCEQLFIFGPQGYSDGKP